MSYKRGEKFANCIRNILSYFNDTQLHTTVYKSKKKKKWNFTLSLSNHFLSYNSVAEINARRKPLILIISSSSSSTELSFWFLQILSTMISKCLRRAISKGGNGCDDLTILTRLRPSDLGRRRPLQWRLIRPTPTWWFAGRPTLRPQPTILAILPCRIRGKLNFIFRTGILIVIAMLKDLNISVYTLYHLPFQVWSFN